MKWNCHIFANFQGSLKAYSESELSLKSNIFRLTVAFIDLNMEEKQ